MIFIDSNVLIDLFGSGQLWYDWSYKATAEAGTTDRLVVNIVTVAEVAPRLGSLEMFLAKLDIIGAEIEAMSCEGAFAAGSAFDQFRKRRRQGQERGSTVLPDFLIGGHAQTLGATILTRDPRFYRAYFPSVPLITPSKDDQ